MKHNKKAATSDKNIQFVCFCPSFFSRYTNASIFCVAELETIDMPSSVPLMNLSSFFLTIAGCSNISVHNTANAIRDLLTQFHDHVASRRCFNWPLLKKRRSQEAIHSHWHGALFNSLQGNRIKREFKKNVKGDDDDNDILWAVMCWEQGKRVSLRLFYCPVERQTLKSGSVTQHPSDEILSMTCTQWRNAWHEHWTTSMISRFQDITNPLDAHISIHLWAKRIINIVGHTQQVRKHSSGVNMCVAWPLSWTTSTVVWDIHRYPFAIIRMPVQPCLASLPVCAAMILRSDKNSTKSCSTWQSDF